jgi:hypothetical protein
VVVLRDLEASVRFYQDGIGLDLLQDRQVEYGWPDLFHAPSQRGARLPGVSGLRYFPAMLRPLPTQSFERMMPAERSGFARRWRCTNMPK